MSNRDALKHLGKVTPATRAIAGEIADHLTSLGYKLPSYGSPYNGPVMHGYANGSEHGTGRAIDVMVMSPGAMGDAVAAFVWKHRNRYDLQHVIWKQRIRSTKVSPGVWRKMSDRGSGTNNHMDHPHIFLGVNARPLGSSSGGSQSTTPAPRPAVKYYKPTGTDLTVKQIQGIVGAKADGAYGPATKKAVAAYQKKLGVTADGLWGKLTQAAHDKKGSSTPKPKPAPKPKPKPAAKAPKFPLKKGHYFGPKSGPAASVSGYYSHRADLKKWQAQMKKRGWKITADGLYGPATEKVARQFQAEKRGLAVDGLIGPATWAAAWTAPVT